MDLSAAIGAVSLVCNFVTMMIVGVKLGRWSGIVDEKLLGISTAIGELPCKIKKGEAECQNC